MESMQYILLSFLPLLSGTPAMTSRGLVEEDFVKVAGFLHEVQPMMNGSGLGRHFDSAQEAPEILTLSLLPSHPFLGPAALQGGPGQPRSIAQGLQRRPRSPSQGSGDPIKSRGLCCRLPHARLQSLIRPHVFHTCASSGSTNCRITCKSH